MKKSLLRVGVAVSAAALIAGFAGSIGTGHGTAHADGPSLQLDFSGLSGLAGLASPGDWSQPAAQPATAPAPQSPIEPAATTTAPAPAPAPASVPQTSPAPATLRLPSTGTGTGPGNGIALLALVAAAVGVACFGAARMVRAEGVRA